MNLEVVDSVQFINVYVVRKIYSYTYGDKYITSFGLETKDSETSKVNKIPNPPFNLKIPNNIIEVYLTEPEAIKRVENLSQEQDACRYNSQVSVKKHLALTANNGETVSLLDCINTFHVKK